MPSPDDLEAGDSEGARRPSYMGLQAGTLMRDIAVDTVFIGSHQCAIETAGRGAPGDGYGRAHAGGAWLDGQEGGVEAEGLHEVFAAAGFDWREAGCSMCLAMNPDKLEAGEVPTSNRTPRAVRGRAGGRTWCVARGGRCHRDAGHLRQDDLS